MWFVFSAQCLCLIVLTVRGWPRWFLLALALWAVQTFSVNIGRTNHWRDTWWFWGETAAMLATSMAVGESIRAVTAGAREYDQFQIRVASFGIAFCIAGTGAYFLCPAASFSALREWIWCFLVLRIAVAGLLLALCGGTGPRIVRWHFLTLVAVCAAHALIGPFIAIGNGTWFELHRMYRGIMVGCCLLWIITAAIGGWPEVQRRDQRRRGAKPTRVAVAGGSREPA